MRSLQLLTAILLLPVMVLAQRSEPVKSDKKAKKADPQQVFVFPDSIKMYKKEMNALVEDKTKLLTSYIKKIATGTDVKKNIAGAMALFNNNENRMVTVTSKAHPEPATKPVRQYLNDVAKLHYSNVSIVWHNAQYVSNFTKQPDGTYSALVAFEQEFTGVKAGEASYTYHDVTQKRAEVVVKVWDHKTQSGKKEAYMDVFLGNIGVAEE